MTEAIKLFVGCDIGDKFSELLVIDGSGEVVDSLRVRTTRPALRAWLERCPRARVVLEVGVHSRWVSHLVAEFGHEVIVANPRQTRLIGRSHKKSDRRDAEMLARLGRMDPKLLSPIRHRADAAQADLVTIRARDALVRERTRLVNHVRGIIKPFAARIPSNCSPDGFHKKARTYIPEELREGIEPALACIEVLNAQIATCNKRIEARAEAAYPETKRLRQVAGVGPVTSLAYVLTLEDPTRFAGSRAVGAFVGLTPAKHQSGESDPERRITKAGDPLLRRLLVNCAQYILARGPDSDLKRWGLVIASHGRKNAKKRAVVATARKLAVLLHRLWTSGERYVPLGYSAARVAA